MVLLVDARTDTELFSGGAVDQPLPPGSILKLLVALATAAERPQALVKPRLCPPRPPGIEHGPPDGHGLIDLEDALARSCNRYFALLGYELGAPPLFRAAAALGLPMTPPAARVPAGELALGTGLRLSARQLLTLLRTVVPTDPGAERPLPLPHPPPAQDDEDVVERTRRRVREGLCRAVTRGTARAAGEGGLSACGKTGTALLGESTIGWFVGYAPAGLPRVHLVLGLPGKLGRHAARAAHSVLVGVTP